MAVLHSSHVLSEVATTFHRGLAAVTSARAMSRRQRPRLLPKNLTRNTCPSQDLINFVRHLQN
uniref:Uncharacterized protein n=1 Tax=Panthera leo TaxID=9689 RepID=A0A8C8Y8W2_PANLE